jgi:hypothetical protein
MEEVELTSEFALLMLTGVGKKEQPAITNAYKRYEEQFPQGREVARRFHAVMDFIEDNFDVRVTPFASKALFYSLFGAVYDLQFGIGTDVVREGPKGIGKDRVSWMRSAAERISEKTAPDQVVEATERRTTDAGSRQRLIGYLAHP